MTISFIISDIPPSINALYKRSKLGGLYLNPKAIAFKKLVSDTIATLDVDIIDKDVKVDIEFTVLKKNCDIDNMLKVMLDSLNKLVYTDDKLVYELNVKKIVGKMKQTKITVSIL